MPFHLAAFFVTAHGVPRRAGPHQAAGRPPDGVLPLVALGGALGGAFNVLVAPVLFTTVLEYPLMLVAACALRPSTLVVPEARPGRLRLATLMVADVLLVLFAIRFQKGFGFDLRPDGPAIAGAVVVSCLVAVLCYAEKGRALRLAGALGSLVVAAGVVRGLRPDILLAGRNFYGTHEVTEGRNGIRYLLHGTTIHGAQNTEPSRRREPATYYSHEGPLGDAFRALPGGPGRRVAVIGLGTGSAAAYARPGDRWVFYEIDPAIERIALDRRLFTFLSDAPGEIQTRLGDGRLLMGPEPAAGYDLILLDAFSSDAIPVHLLTVEAMELYLRKLAPDGAVLFHLSNRFLNMEPVVAGLRARASPGGPRSPGPSPHRAPGTSGRDRLQSGRRWRGPAGCLRARRSARPGRCSRRPAMSRPGRTTTLASSAWCERPDRERSNAGQPASRAPAPAGRGPGTDRRGQRGSRVIRSQ